MQAVDHKEEDAARPEPKPRNLVFTGIALLLLLALTAGLSWVNLGRFNTPVALLIAVAKALLILFIFMEVGFSKKLIWIYASVGFIWLGILFTLSLSDFLSRNYLNIPGK
ncbi:MAG TPA: cytochrome C oxidase subunit IV family protein [Chthonomonadaceae bacterium]|nr:cytochrome C oxidase subunit IV family protein [Chthonomonadaceae bacterium]